MFLHQNGAPDAPVVLFLHGGGVGGWMWQPVIAELGTEVRAIAPDLPGHDRSAEVAVTSHAEIATSLTRVLDAEVGARPVVVAGFSFGAQLAMQLAASDARVTGAVVVSAQAIPARGVGPTVALLRAAAPLARNERFARAQARELGIPETLMPNYLRTSREMSADALARVVEANLRYQPPAEWAGRGIRVEVVVGAKERGLMRRSAEAIVASAPQAQLTVVPEAGHTTPLTHPRVIADLVRRVL